MAFCGQSFLIPASNEGGINPHLWIVITEPDGADGSCLIVSLTTLRYGKDQTVILRVGEHPFIQHETIVFYRNIRITTQKRLEEQVQNGEALLKESCPPETLTLIRQGVGASEFTPQKFLMYYRAHQT